ncbi:hypothetical protein HMPREF1544_11754 [Mucor circinelloides 1006PhL]|uniref:Reverse transcriptase domain-containing protein n=1 Tax=Mucor circinelloides f. circinelloides (strain 1006PhL) TaxID=1220926 RepID=S2JG87_MUCC1|nr:hypothetical protein HMPREF1544_11754 [Mucor circinelloides 1006PhL]
MEEEGIPALRDIIEQDDWLCKVDLKDACLVVPMHKNSKDYLTFENQEGAVYRYKSLIFGLSVSLRVFNKIMKRHLFTGKDERDGKVSNQSKASPGSSRFYYKLQKKAQKNQEFVGFIFNTRNMQILVPQLKINNLLKRVKQVLRHQQKQ